MNRTSIQWTDRTWNPIRGCSRVSPGCDNCYAMRQARRFDHPGGPYEGLTRIGPRGVDWSGKVTLVESALLEPLSWRKPQRVFVNSMSDLFHPAVPEQAIIDIFGVMALAHWHTFQVLTKRPGRMREFVATGSHGIIEQFQAIQRAGGIANRRVFRALDRKRRDSVEWAWPLPNVWLGTSCEDQQRFNERVGHLAHTPAAVRFLSLEPLLGPISWNGYTVGIPWAGGEARGGRNYSPLLDFIHWVIVGGESGHSARRCDVAWLRSIRRQCGADGVAFFLKQMGSFVVDRNDAGFMGDEPDHWPEDISFRDAVEHDLDGTRDGYQGAPVRIHLLDRKGGDPSEWPEDLRVRQFPRSAVPA